MIRAACLSEMLLSGRIKLESVTQYELDEIRNYSEQLEEFLKNKKND